LTPVKSPPLQDQLTATLEAYLSPSAAVWSLNADGTWAPPAPGTLHPQEVLADT